jgi:hypothetical protein
LIVSYRERVDSAAHRCYHPFRRSDRGRQRETVEGPMNAAQEQAQTMADSAQKMANAWQSAAEAWEYAAEAAAFRNDWSAEAQRDAARATYAACRGDDEAADSARVDAMGSAHYAEEQREWFPREE